MIHADIIGDMYDIEINGDLFDVVGAEAVLILGEIFEQIEERDGEEAAKQFIMIIASAAISGSARKKEVDANLKFTKEEIDRITKIIEKEKA
jgi:hypothetical protein